MSTLCHSERLVLTPTQMHSVACHYQKSQLVEPEVVLLAEHLDKSPVTAADIRTWTSRDPKLSRVLQYVQCWWPDNGDSELEPYYSRHVELSLYEGCLMWGTRVVIPQPG